MSFQIPKYVFTNVSNEKVAYIEFGQFQVNDHEEVPNPPPPPLYF